MAASCKIFSKLKNISNIVNIPKRYANTLQNRLVERHRQSRLSQDPPVEEKSVVQAPRDFRYVYPEFLPDTDMRKRDRICERLERRDMMRRRAVLEIPEFYVGSVMAISVADPNAPGKKNRFIGICINRGGHGLRAHCTLRNIVDGQGVEIMYELYNPVLQKIDVLKLEKRLDEELFYLRDAPQEYSYVPFDFESVIHPPGVAVPVNQMKVKLGPRPWHERWERKELKGVADLGLAERFYQKAAERAQPWEKYDMIKNYRKNINDDETDEIMSEVYAGQKKIDRKKGKKKMIPTDK